MCKTSQSCRGLGMLTAVAVALWVCRILDNLPVAMVKMRKSEKSDSLIKTYERGFPVGFRATLEVRPLACAPHPHTCSAC